MPPVVPGSVLPAGAYMVIGNPSPQPPQKPKADFSGQTEHSDEFPPLSRISSHARLMDNSGPPNPNSPSNPSPGPPWSAEPSNPSPGPSSSGDSGAGANLISQIQHGSGSPAALSPVSAEDLMPQMNKPAPLPRRKKYEPSIMIPGQANMYRPQRPPGPAEQLSDPGKSKTDKPPRKSYSSPDPPSGSSGGASPGPSSPGEEHVAAIPSSKINFTLQIITLFVTTSLLFTCFHFYKQNVSDDVYVEFQTSFETKPFNV